MNRRLLASSASTLPGKNSGLAADSEKRASSNLIGFSLSVFFSRPSLTSLAICWSRASYRPSPEPRATRLPSGSININVGHELAS